MSQQQTWTEWFFGTSSTPTSSDENSQSTNESGSGPNPPHLPAPASDSKSSHASPYGPYVRTGRGGAGNYTWQSEVQAQESNSNDIEALKTPDLTEQADITARIEQHDTETALRNQARSNNSTQYVRVGRGMIERKDLETATSATTTPASDDSRSSAPNISRSSNTASATVRPAYRGRGGAGNYAAALDVTEKQKAEKDEQDRLAAEQRREQVTQHVENTVPAPPGVWLGEQKRSLQPRS